VDKYIVSTGLLDESISLLCIKPFHNPFCQDIAPLYIRIFLEAFDIIKQFACQDFYLFSNLPSPGDCVAIGSKEKIKADPPEV